MNFVIICIDTLRYDYLACNDGYAVPNDIQVKTPNLDAFAREAVVFDNAYVGSFPTIPHRTDVFTGQFGRPLHPWLPLGFDAVTLPAVLGQAGWATYLAFDTPHLINGGHGFDYPWISTSSTTSAQTGPTHTPPTTGNTCADAPTPSTCATIATVTGKSNGHRRACSRPRVTLSR